MQLNQLLKNTAGFSLMELLLGGVVLGVILLLPRGPIVSGFRSINSLVNSVNHGKERKGYIADLAKRIPMSPTAPTLVCPSPAPPASTPCHGISFNRNFIGANGAITRVLLTYFNACEANETGVTYIDPGIYRCVACLNGSLPVVRVTSQVVPNAAVAVPQLGFPLGPRKRRLETSVAGALCVTQSGRSYEIELLSLVSDEKGKTRVVKDQVTAVAQDPDSRVQLLR